MSVGRTYGATMFAALTGLLLGFFLGMRHALEPDHLAAVSTLVTEQRSAGRGAILGAFWGIGHTLSLFGVGVVLALLETQMPPRLADGFELAVALMLLLLGVRAIARALQQGGLGHAHAHAHMHGDGSTGHEHGGPDDHVHVFRWTLARRPLLVGLVHGLAGSGALTALVLASLPGVGARLLYIALFGIGSVCGMAVLSGLVGFPLARLSRREGAMRWLSAATGVFSVAFGLFWGWPLVGRLFL